MTLILLIARSLFYVRGKRRRLVQPPAASLRIGSEAPSFLHLHTNCLRDYQTTQSYLSFLRRRYPTVLKDNQSEACSAVAKLNHCPSYTRD